MIKLHIKENAISDLRKFVDKVSFDQLANQSTGRYDYKYTPYSRNPMRGDFKADNKNRKEALVKWLENIFRDWTTYDFNAQDLSVIPVQKPKGPTVAKKSEQILIGINSNTGDAVVVGQGKFFEYYSGMYGHGNKPFDDRNPEDPVPDYGNAFKHRKVSLRDTFENLDIWLEVIPKDPDTYQNRRAIRDTRNHDLIKYNDGKLSKLIYAFEQSLYDPETARDKYADRLKSYKDKQKYSSLLNSIDDINDRIRNIEFGHPIFDAPTFNQVDIVNLQKSYKTLVNYVDLLNDEIEKSHAWSGDSGVKYWADKVSDSLNDIDILLTRTFGV